MTLTAAGPAGTAHNPFAGGSPVAAEPVAFPADRYLSVGATPEEVEELSAYFSALTRAERRDAAAWHDEVGDEELTASLGRFREVRDALLALGGLTDEERAVLDGLTEEQRDDLADYVTSVRALDGLTEEEVGALASLTDDDRAVLDALTDEERTALEGLTAEDVAALTASTPVQEGEETPEAEVPAGDADEATETPEEAPGGGETSTEQQPDETQTFTTKDIADLNMAEVEALVAGGMVTAGDALIAESARGDKARPRLIERLNALLPQPGTAE